VNQGARIILKRMETNPEEFDHQFMRAISTSVNTRSGLKPQPHTPDWQWFTNLLEERHYHMRKSKETSELYPTRALPFLSDEDIEALFAAYTTAQDTSFVKRVMAEILE